MSRSQTPSAGTATHSGSSLAQFATRVLDGLVRGEKVISALLVGTITALTFAQVVARYAFKSPFFWSEELARYCYVWCCFIAAAFNAAERTHIRVDVINRLFGLRGRVVLESFSGLVVAGASVFLLYGSWPWLLTNLRPRSPALGISMVWLYGIVFAAFGLIALHTIVGLVRLWRGAPDLVDSLTGDEEGGTIL